MQRSGLVDIRWKRKVKSVVKTVANQRSLTNQGHSVGCIKDLDLYGIDVAINTLHT